MLYGSFRFDWARLIRVPQRRSKPPVGRDPRRSVQALVRSQVDSLEHSALAGAQLLEVCWGIPPAPLPSGLGAQQDPMPVRIARSAPRNRWYEQCSHSEHQELHGIAAGPHRWLLARLSGQATPGTGTALGAAGYNRFITIRQIFCWVMRYWSTEVDEPG